MELKEAIEILKAKREERLPLFMDVRVIYRAIDTVLAELNKLNERIEYALAIAYDYDGYYNPETKKGNAEGLAMTIDDMVDVLKGNLKGVE